MTLIRRILKHRLDLWEVLLLFGLAAAIVYPLTRPPAGTVTDLEIRAFAERYGPDKQTEHEEEWLIRDFFRDTRGGFFVDIGANHHQQLSKTWYLETQLGWSGIAVDANKDFAAGYASHRPRTRYFTFFVSDRSDEAAQLFVISRNTTVASGHKDFVSLFGTPDRVDSVPTITLDDLLAAEKVEKLDFLTIDIELHEPEALRGFDIARHRPRLVCIEALLPVRQAILDYFTRRGYVVEGRYLRADRENLYFRPLDAVPQGSQATP
jgi:FkbM family methyltransferase